MSFIDADVEPDEDARLADAMAQDIADALGEAVDIAAEVRNELLHDKPGGLMHYIADCRAVAVADLAGMFEILEVSDITEPEAIKAVRAVQRTFAKYSSAVAFAQSALRGYEGFGETENLEGDDAEERDVVVVTGAQHGEG